MDVLASIQTLTALRSFKATVTKEILGMGREPQEGKSSMPNDTSWKVIGSKPAGFIGLWNLKLKVVHKKYEICMMIQSRFVTITKL